jgi:hypothetical protein
MMHKLVSLGALACVVLAGCSRGEQRQVTANRSQSAQVAATSKPVVPPPGTGADAKTPLQPAKPVVDPKSSEAAEQLVRAFAKLLQERKFDQAFMLMGAGAPPRRDFDRQFARLSSLSATVGKAGDQEGAAGSIYLSVPLSLSADTDGKHITRSGSVILRRVNDVPGSTEAQRRWHIERIDWAS